MSSPANKDRHPASPFKFLDPYELADKNVFFGRSREVDALYRMVYQTDLLLVYGYSGTGKTSLIRCGLAGRFDGPQWYPFFIRKGKNISRSIRNALLEALESEAPEDYTLAEIIGEIVDEYLSPVYLIFDQFEELFILGSEEERRQEQDEFIGHIQTLLAADFPCKILFIIREEYLGELYRFEQAIPQLFDFKLRVEPMNNLRIREVLSSSFAAFNINLEAPAEARIDEIIRNVGGEKSLIQLPYLQVYLDTLWREDFARTYPDGPPALPPGESYPALTFTAQEIQDFGTIEEVLPLFLSRQEEQIHRQLAQRFPAVAPPREHLRDLLEAFVTQEGTKLPLPFHLEDDRVVFSDAVQKNLKLKNPVLTEAVHALEAGRILRAREGHYELAHDSLAALIAGELSQEKQRQNRILQEIRVLHRAGEFLSQKRLNAYTEDLPKMELEPELAKFVKDSYAHNETLEQEKQRRQQAELEKERSLRAEAETARKEAEENAQRAAQAQQQAEENANQARRWTRVASGFSILALLIAVFAGWQYYKLNQTRERVVNVLIEQAESLIKELKYQEALEKLEQGASLVERYTPLGQAYMEMALYYGAAYRFSKTDSLLSRAASLFRERAWWEVAADTAAALQGLRNALEGLDPAHYKTILHKYYPEMVEVPGGTFLMGADTVRDKNWNSDELPRHEVKLDTYRIARTETTVWQYHLFWVATGKDTVEMESPSWGLWGDNPVVYVTWYDAVDYANWVSRQLGFPEAIMQDTAGNYEVDLRAPGYRLPTEAEWEYAARGGPQQDTFLYSGNDTLKVVGWYRDNSAEGYGTNRRTHPVAKKRANGLGLYDMSGNVWEWCWDWYDSNYFEQFAKKRAENPPGPAKTSIDNFFIEFGRVLRGGSWDVEDFGCGSSVRFRLSPWNGSYSDGFRLARD